MDLQPKRQPGRVDRKAALFAAEIARLRNAGYTYAAIREALAGVGVVLTESTLRREMRRELRSETRRETRQLHAENQCLPWTPSLGLLEPANSALLPTFAPSPHPSAARRSKGHEIAEAFFKAHHSNPLLQPKETP